MSTVLELRNVTKNYEQGRLFVKALDNLDLKIRKGEFIAILGPSGSGKSTLLNILGCLDLPTSGSIFLENQEISKISKKEQAKVRQKIGVVFQKYNLIQRLNILQNIELALLCKNSSETKDIRKRKSEKILGLVGLTTRKEHTPKELSGGQQQRVAIGRALVRKPSFLLLDEPTGSVDIKTRDQIMKLIVKLNKSSKITVILVTHDLQLAELADRVLCLVDGKFVPRDEYEQLLSVM